MKRSNACHLKMRRQTLSLVCRSKKDVDGNMFKGQVVEIKVRRLYLIRYDDGHLEHLTGEQVKECKIEKESEPIEDEAGESELDELSESDEGFFNMEDSSNDSGDSDFVTKPAKRPEDACILCGRNQGSQFYGGRMPGLLF